MINCIRPSLACSCSRSSPFTVTLRRCCTLLHQFICSILHLRMARCLWFEKVLGDQKLSSDLLLTFITVDFDIQLGMWTCGHDTSHQFGERLLVHVEEHSANRWKDCVKCCRSHSGGRVAGHVPWFLSVLEQCTCRSLLREFS